MGLVVPEGRIEIADNIFIKEVNPTEEDEKNLVTIIFNTVSKEEFKIYWKVLKELIIFMKDKEYTFKDITRVAINEGIINPEEESYYRLEVEFNK